MGASTIVDEGEVLRWFEEGRTYQWMSDEYLRKYGIERSIASWGNFRRRRGLEHRIVRDDALIPWQIKEEHRWAYPVTMLRAEGRRRAGLELTENAQARLDSWKANLAEEGVVVHYDPDTEEGFFYVAPRKGVDTDLIRQPTRKDGRRSVD